MCNVKPPHDLTNITGNYSRDLNNWAYFCRACHFKFDYSKGIRKLTEDAKQKIAESVRLWWNIKKQDHKFKDR
jgi:hypothetical protein